MGNVVIYPAIDLLGGACVRLWRGSFDRVTGPARDPLEAARGFVAAGARALHVVDLDGARSGRPVSAELALRIVREAPVPVQVGGGLRTDGDAARYLDGGAARVILGTGAVSDPDWLARLVARHGADRIAAAVDVRDGRPAVRGWVEEAAVELPALLASLSEAGVRTVVYTDTTRDGTLDGPDLGGMRAVAEAGFETIVAGGVAGAEDVRRAAAAGAAGVVIGSALVRGLLTVAEAQAAALTGSAARGSRPAGAGAGADAPC